MRMSPKLRKLAVGAVALFLAFGFTSARAFNGPAACMFLGLADLHELPDGSLTDTSSPEEQDRYVRLTFESRERIANTFGEPTARPVLVYFSRPDGFGPFKLNAFGSTQFIGPRACVMIGPKGQNIDVVAHELMHAEIHERAGYWNRFMHIPTWFDEGLAMQVDYRPQYVLAAEDEHAKDAVRQLTSFSSFFNGGEKVVVSNYAKARAIVAEWVTKVGKGSVYSRLHQLRAGESFEEAIQ